MAKIPRFRTEEEIREFWDTHDSAEYFENISADVCMECGAEYLPSEVDKHVEGVVENIIANKVKPSMEEVYRVSMRMRERGVV
uniref:Uncharacterized protein n=1 Tax=Candidatus Methanophagaceae archaeon ANME-1 ERB6 TaxID=2759912 RepID=A0A7G9Z0X7_9EURY|nr:hypothetical protein NNHBGCAA_00011 [Methanosarcinales archaeon ANME-1 ERB6]